MRTSCDVSRLQQQTPILPGHILPVRVIRPVTCRCLPPIRLRLDQASAMLPA